MMTCSAIPCVVAPPLQQKGKTKLSPKKKNRGVKGSKGKSMAESIVDTLLYEKEMDPRIGVLQRGKDRVYYAYVDGVRRERYTAEEIEFLLKKSKGSKVSESANPYKDDGCPECGEHAVTSCRCGGPHSPEQLKSGHA